MAQVIIYTSRLCPFCIRAKKLLDAKKAAYNEIKVDGNPAIRSEMVDKAGATSVPQIWIGDNHVGGCDQLVALENQGKLDALLAAD
ncbi:MAG: glutaredoxin 3 [Gammaproteobacteria bacterium]|nr:MAG: glutaredoxin 3 [Gammaproteobacteria bacterium]